MIFRLKFSFGFYSFFVQVLGVNENSQLHVSAEFSVGFLPNLYLLAILRGGGGLKKDHAGFNKQWRPRAKSLHNLHSNRLKYQKLIL